MPQQAPEGSLTPLRHSFFSRTVLSNSGHGGPTMTRGAKIVVFSVVGLFVLAGIYYGFMAPTAPSEPISDSTPTVSESPTLTLTPTVDGQTSDAFGAGLPPVGGTTLAGTEAGAHAGNAAGLPPMSGPAFAGSAHGPIGTPTVATQNPVALGGAAFPIEVNATPADLHLTNSPDSASKTAASKTAASTTTASKTESAKTESAKKVATAKAAKTSSYTVYTVESGDTLTAIAGEWFKDTSKWKEIVAVNPGLSASTLKVGQKINLPAKSGSVSTKVANATKSASATVTAADQHVVASGETLASISDKAYGNRTNWKKIYEANKSVIGDNPSALKVGMKLTIPAKQS